MPHIAYIGLGANLEQPAEQLRQAFAALGQLPQTELLAVSSLYVSAPVGYLDQPDFTNAVAKLSTDLGPAPLLDALLELEHRFGRVRQFRNAPRTLDLDLLLYDDQKLKTPTLQLPHPRMHERAFVLLPLAEISPELVIPQQGGVRALLQRCSEQTVRRMDSNTD